MTHPLDGAIKRIERAQIHITEATVNAQQLGEIYKQQLVPQYDAATNQVFFNITMPENGPSVVLPVSDAIHNLRSALDYIVFALAKHDSGGIAQDGTQFPIEDVKSGTKPGGNKYGFDTRRNTYLKGLTDAHVLAIEEFQPYKGVQWTKTLRDISNPDKHRELVAVFGNIGMGGVVSTGAAGSFDGRPGTIFRNVGPEGAFDVYSENSMAITETFSDGLPVIKTLQLMKSEISAAIELFKPEF